MDPIYGKCSKCGRMGTFTKHVRRDKKTGKPKYIDCLYVHHLDTVVNGRAKRTQCLIGREMDPSEFGLK